MPSTRPAAEAAATSRPAGPGGSPTGSAAFAGLRARDVVESVDLRARPAALLDGGPWFVVATFEGDLRAWRFAHVDAVQDAGPESAGPEGAGGPWRGRGDGVGAASGVWHGPDAGAWTSSLDAAAYRDAVARIRAAVRDGDVYQANLCRVLSAPLAGADGAEPDAAALAAVLAAQNPAPYGGHLHVPASSTAADPAWVVSASPELFLSLRDGVLTSGPIKGTAPTVDGLRDKDRAENVMITDLVRNDLQRVCEPGTVEVVDLLAAEEHPGLVHLVSRVAGRLRDVGWPEILDATFPPASVSGAPKSSALRIIRALEPVPRGPYCGAFGWVDAAHGRAELAVAIRSFWWRDGVLRFGTGAGITWGSDPDGEWEETELKASRLVALASGPVRGAGSGGADGQTGTGRPTGGEGP